MFSVLSLKLKFNVIYSCYPFKASNAVEIAVNIIVQMLGNQYLHIEHVLCEDFLM